MKKLDVIFNGWGQHIKLASLADNGRDLLFEYSQEAMALGVEHSPIRLKLRSEAYGNFPDYQFRLPGLISDALPDGWGLLLMEKMFAKLGRDRRTISPLDRLAFIGERAMGALSFLPSTDLLLQDEDVNLLSLAKTVHLEMSEQEIPALRSLVHYGGSPHGARPKVLVNYDTTSHIISTDAHQTGTPWLIKFQAQYEHKEVCAIEHLYAHLAQQCGMEIPKTQYFDLDENLAAFGIERFDRYQGMRVPLHSLAGLLHSDFRLPSVDYQTFLRATRAISNSYAELEKGFERCVFNVIFNNRDDHAKNLSFRMDENLHWKLSPCYDLTFNEGPNGEHQMDIQGEGKQPNKDSLLKLATAVGINTTQANRIIEKQTEVASAFAQYASNYPIRKTTTAYINKKIQANLLLMR